MSGQWPPDWEDPDGDAGAEAEQAEAAADARLSEVTAYLAALPDPVLPEAFQARISAALEAEAADRAAAAGTATGATTGTATGAKRARTGERTLERGSRRPRIRVSRRFGVRAISSVAACMVFAALGYALTLAGGSSSSSSEVAGGLAQSASSTAAGSASAPNNGFRAAAGGPVPAAAEPSATAYGAARFVVISRGDVYQKSTLVSEVRSRLTASRPSGISNGSAASSALVGCVVHVTGGTAPGLVDKATYAGKPVYVIATSSRAWVVGRGCSATDSELITSVSLGGLRGNLSALGSVEA